MPTSKLDPPPSASLLRIVNAIHRLPADPDDASRHCTDESDAQTLASTPDPATRDRTVQSWIDMADDDATTVTLMDPVGWMLTETTLLGETTPEVSKVSDRDRDPRRCMAVATTDRDS